MDIELDLYIDVQSGIPIYRQIMDGIRYASSSGRLLPGDRLPSVRNQAGALRVNPATVQKAYRELELRGLVEARRGLGTFVVAAPLSVGEKERIETLWREMQSLLATARELSIDRDELVDLFNQGLDDAYAEVGVE